MKIAHLCLSNFYIDGLAYQENELVAAHIRAGHEVRVIASTEVFDDARRLTYCAPGRYTGEKGETVIRLPYRRVLPAKLARKLRMHPGVARELEDFAPDAMLFHGLAGWEIMTAARYARAHPEVIFHADSHEDFNNSARSFLSREGLHKRFYGPVLRRAEGAAEKLLCISLETMDFVHEVYRIPRARLEFFPLGGAILDDAAHAALRARTRAALDLSDDAILLVQAGKQTARKKLIDSLRALAEAPDPRLRLVVAGSLDDAIRAEAEALIAADPRVTYLGWQDADALRDLLAAADVYLQPGTQSVTMQASLCARCAVILDDAPSHAPYMSGNGWLLNDALPLGAALRAVSERAGELAQMGARSHRIAREMLDYDTLAKRVLRREGEAA